MIREINLRLEELENESMLGEADQQLVREAKKNTEFAYAPYSGFKVAAVARLKNGAIVSGTNQENASYPVGICAERTLLSAVSSLYPNAKIDTIAITYHNTNGDSSQPVAPCGICRQTLLEYELRTNNPIRLLLAGNEGKIIIVEKASSLLPLGFSSDDMNR
jgi:cytidine deaminase